MSCCVSSLPRSSNPRAGRRPAEQPAELRWCPWLANDVRRPDRAGEGHHVSQSQTQEHQLEQKRDEQKECHPGAQTP